MPFGPLEMWGDKLSLEVNSQYRTQSAVKYDFGCGVSKFRVFKIRLFCQESTVLKKKVQKFKFTKSVKTKCYSPNPMQRLCFNGIVKICVEPRNWLDCFITFFGFFFCSVKKGRNRC